jgi:Malectin domain
VFDVYVENSLIAAGFDIVKQAGPNTAVVLERIVSVNDGGVTIELVKGIENPAINGIEIIATSDPVPAPTPAPPTAPIAPPTAPTSTAVVRINVGGDQFIDTAGNTWIADNYFGGKGASYGSCPAIVANTLDDDLYCTNRWFGPWHGPPFVYSIRLSMLANIKSASTLQSW